VPVYDHLAEEFAVCDRWFSSVPGSTLPNRLFLVGIGSSFQLWGVRYALIAFGTMLLIFSIVLILQQPGPPS
jgi:Phosphoesterase family